MAVDAGLGPTGGAMVKCGVMAAFSALTSSGRIRVSAKRELTSKSKSSSVVDAAAVAAADDDDAVSAAEVAAAVVADARASAAENRRC